MARGQLLSRGFLVVVFVFFAAQTFVARDREAAAWARANEARSSDGCKTYLAWATGTLTPPSGLLTRLRAVLTPWVSPIEAHQQLATQCPAPIDSRWTR